MTYKEMTERVAEDMGLSPTFVHKVYRAYWKSIKEHIESLPLKEDLTDEEFAQLRPNVNIPSLGKLNVTEERYRRIKKEYNEAIKRK